MHLFGSRNSKGRPVFATLLRHSVRANGAHHAERYHRTSAGDVARSQRLSACNTGQRCKKLAARGLEPRRREAQDPKSCVSAISPSGRRDDI
jgi:hypothetical protein